uniref:VWFA domain-containing protein n=1 Tax=Malurus cyaneus samueli TaxID=2593467 RepID=A0A8C5X279_9PASS
CDRTIHTSGVCVLLDTALTPWRELSPGWQGCQRGPVDLVFLFDGSSSMNPSQFGAICDFMVDTMEKLDNGSFRFGAVQFSDRVQTVFSLADFAARPRPRELLRGLEQSGGLTDTFTAIGYAVRTLFSAERGARPEARRVLVLITDGDATDSTRTAASKQLRSVGHNFGSADTRLYLQQFASGPGSVQLLESFERLRGLFRELQARLYDIEGIATELRSLRETPPTRELPHFWGNTAHQGNHGRRVTGAVGADNWAGGLLDMGDPESFVPNPHRNESEGYLGYSVAGLRVPGRLLVAAGAPRHRHVGGTVLFEVARDGGAWRELQTLLGDQVGSYFGATLCALDQAGVTVALLVGAPGHYDGRRGGRDTLRPSGHLWGTPGHPLGRFGASLATLGDLDNDQLPEVAVGAPLEDEERGAVYIYGGCPGGVEPLPRQRLPGQTVAPGRFFGLAVAGGLDLTGDGLADVAVGMEGHVVVMRSRPVLRVTPQLTFDPVVIPSRWLDCSGVTEGVVTVQLCLQPPGPGVDTGWTWGWTHGMDIGWTQGVDMGWTHRVDTGWTHGPCIEDLVTPLGLSVTLTLPHSDPPGPILAPNSTPTWAEIPVEQNCGADQVCRANLSVKVVKGGTAVVGVPEAHLGVQLMVQNYGEDAYGAALQMQLPMGLAFRWAQASQVCATPKCSLLGRPRPLCPGPRGFLVSPTLSCPIDSVGRPTDATLIPPCPTHRQEDSTHHLNFTPPQPHNKTVWHGYRVSPPNDPQVTPMPCPTGTDPNSCPTGGAPPPPPLGISPGAGDSLCCCCLMHCPMGGCGAPSVPSGE